MGLDVYAGTLTRYYSDDWETLWARRAREAGIESMTLRVDKGGVRKAEKGDPDEVRCAVLAWRKALNEAILTAPGHPKLDWDEGAEKPYFTDKPDWDGYAALMLHAAHAINPDIKGRPTEVPEDWREDEAYKACTGENLHGSPCGYIMAPELWLPGDFLFLFQCTELRGQEVVVGSTEALLSNLHGLNERTFRADPETAARWLSCDVEETNPFEAHARHGFAVLLYLAEEAVSHELPLKLDY